MAVTDTATAAASLEDVTITDHSTALNAEGCLFCRRHDGGFRSCEHPFPESLGNEEYVLEPGIVCDRCNSGPLSDVDKAFLDFPPISLVRTLNAVRTKAGKFPSSRWGNAVVTIPSEGHLHMRTNSKKAFRTVGQPRPDGYQEFKFSLKSARRATPEYTARVTRGLWKIALGMLYLEHGRDVFDPRLDEVRAMVLGEQPARGWLMTIKRTVPVESVSLTVFWPPALNGALQESAAVLLNAYGIQMGTDLLVRVPYQPRGEAAEAVDLNVF